MFTTLSTFGLILNFVGAVVIAWTIWTLGDHATFKAWAARVSGGPPPKQDDAFALRERRFQRNLAIWGTALLPLGFLLQLIGTAGARTAPAVVSSPTPSFWTIFWAVLLAVFVAHLVAAPLSMGVWAWYAGRRGWRTRSQFHQGGLVCLTHLRRALETNIRAGRWYHQQPLAARPRPYGLEIDSATWQAFRHELATCLGDDPQLRIDLAGYFADIDEFNRAHEEYLQMCAQDAPPPSEAEQGRIVNRVQRLAYQAEVGGKDLLARVAALSQTFGREA